MSAVANYHVSAIGVEPDSCPSCGTLNDQPECGVCGFSYAPPPVRVVVASPPPPDVIPPGYKISCFQSERCLCGCVKILIESSLQCPECGEFERPQPKPIEVVSRGLPEPDIAPPECQVCLQTGIPSSRFDIVGGGFVCCECGQPAGPVRVVKAHAVSAPEPKASFTPAPQPSPEPPAALPEAVTPAPPTKKKRR